MPSTFPLFPYAAFVLAGAVAGAGLGRQDPAVRRRRAVVWGVGLLVAGAAVALALKGIVPFWGPSPGYALLRMGGLLLLLRVVEDVSRREWPGSGRWPSSDTRRCSSTSSISTSSGAASWPPHRWARWRAASASPRAWRSWSS